MQFPNEIQAALLFDRRVADLEAIVRTFARIEEARSGARFNVPEAKQGVFYRLFGGDELMITLEYIDRPAELAVFQQTLTSAITGIMCPDIRQRLMLNKSHILVNVSHGVLGNSPEVLRLLNQLDFPREGHSLAQFTRRLEVCALLARIACDEVPAQAVHWTQSNQLVPGEAFESFAAGGVPGPLHVHPYLFGPREAGPQKVGIRTFGARHFIGREVLIEPSELPWAANFETILAFLRVATTRNGYIIPDGDCFGPEDRSLSYRVVHREADEGDVPLCELQPLLHTKYGFVAPDYVPPERVFDDRMPPADLMPADEEAKMELANEWREKRALAEGIGGRFEVRSRGEGPAAGPPSPAPGAQPGGPGFGGRAGFGRKQVGR
jgi:hypothetical protein